MKVDTGTVSHVQRGWMQHLETEGWFVKTCYSGEQAISTLVVYLNRAR